MRHLAAGSLRFPLIWVALALLPRMSLAIEIRFDYRYDSSGVFDAPERRAALDYAAQTFEVFTDQLSPIFPSLGTWNAQFSHPSAASVVNLGDLSVAANEVVIFVGAYDLEGSAVARGTVGAFSSVTGSRLLETLQTRGQPNASGSAPTDFARWGGVISFDTQRTGETTPRAWHFDPYSLPTNGSMDFVSVALHEIAHVLGFSISPNSATPLSFERFLDEANNIYTGPNVVATNGGPVSMDSSGHHWNKSVRSEYDGNAQVPIMASTLYTGTRRGFTKLDYAAMADIGWEVPTEFLEPPVELRVGDYDGDTEVSLLDYRAWRATFGSTDLVADGNQDRQVNAADFVMWRNAFNPGTLIVGDFDINQTVDIFDYNVWSRNFGSTTDLAADANLNGNVDAADFVLWRDNFGRGAFGSGTEVTAVPEPSLMALMIVGMALVLCSRARCQPKF